MDSESEASASAPPVAPCSDAVSIANQLFVEPRYFNREMSWLAFNRRVLEEASNPRHPLLERVRFLSISANNLDEFFMVRVAGLKAHQAIGVEEISPEGLTVAQQLSAITLEADRLVTSQHEVWAHLQEELDASAMHVVGDEPLDPEAETWLDKHFREQIFPVLTPQAIDPAHPFPFIPNKGLSLIFELRKAKTSVRELIMAPAALPRFIRIPGHPAGIFQSKHSFVEKPTICSRNMKCFEEAPSGSFATATSKLKKKRKIWFSTFGLRSRGDAAAGS